MRLLLGPRPSRFTFPAARKKKACKGARRWWSSSGGPTATLPTSPCQSRELYTPMSSTSEAGGGVPFYGTSSDLRSTCRRVVAPYKPPPSLLPDRRRTGKWPCKRGRWSLVHDWLGRLARHRKCKKCPVLLARPTGLEPVFPP